KARGDFLLFLNPDAVMPDGGVARLLADGKPLQRPWVMGAKIVNPEGGEQQGSRRAVLTPWRAFVEATRIYKLAPRHPYFRRFNLHKEPCPAETTQAPVISGACFFTPRADYFSIGGMDERYFLHVEDIDFCLRIAEAGGGVYFNPHVGVVHHKSSSRVNPLRVEYRKTASMLRYFRRHFADAYPPPFLWVVTAALWTVFALKALRRGLSRMLALIGLRARRGAAGSKRARAIAAKRASR
ncbi:MAG: glycosyltransferase family 2 protein, partial [Parvularculaceae bacterium]